MSAAGVAARLAAHPALMGIGIGTGDATARITRSDNLIPKAQGPMAQHPDSPSRAVENSGASRRTLTVVKGDATRQSGDVHLVEGEVRL